MAVNTRTHRTHTRTLLLRRSSWVEATWKLVANYLLKFVCLDSSCGTWSRVAEEAVVAAVVTTLGELQRRNSVALYELGRQSRTCAPLFGASVRPVGCVATTPTSLLGGECFGQKFVLCIATYATTDGAEDRARGRRGGREAGQPVIRQSTSAISCSRSLRLHNVRVTEQTNCLTKRANNPAQFSSLCVCACVFESTLSSAKHWNCSCCVLNSCHKFNQALLLSSPRLV